MPSFMWYIIGGAIALFVLGYVVSLIIGAFAFKKMKRNFDEMKKDIDHSIREDKLPRIPYDRIRRP